MSQARAGAVTDVQAPPARPAPEATSRLRAARSWLTAKVSWQSVVSVGILIVAFAIPVRGLMRYQGPPMEEGFMLTFPEQVLHGAIPNRDFLHLYGPGSLWVLAAIYKVFGVSLATERIAGLLQHAAIVFGLYALARPWGRKLAVVSGLAGLFIVLPPLGLTAMAWNGAVAFGVWAVWLGLRVYRPAATPAAAAAIHDPALADDDRLVEPEEWVDTSGAGVRLFFAGLLAGFGLLFRPDLIIAVVLGLGAVAWGLPWRRIRWLVLGGAAGLSPYLVHVALAGLGHSINGMISDPVFRLRSGRSLPVPPSWNHLDGFLQKAAGLRTLGWPFPSPAAWHQVVFWFWLTPIAALFVAGVGWWRVRHDRHSYRARVLFAAGLFGLGMVTQAVQRTDTAHFAWASCVALPMVPVAVAELIRTRARRRDLWPTVGGVAVVAVVLFGLIPHFTLRTYVDLSEQTFGHHVFGYSVNRDGRNFYYGSPTAAAAANTMIKRFDQIGPRAGQRLFVGPVDLRKTPYSDAFFYFLYPELKPATYYIEVDPFDSKPGSRLASDVASADWLILSNVWSNWDEPNDSRKIGSNRPNEVVQREFCEVGAFGHLGTTNQPLFELYRRCK